MSFKNLVLGVYDFYAQNHKELSKNNHSESITDPLIFTELQPNV